ncbi:MAG: hypothetical protein M3Y80_11935 [Verrucomicrobiota bacterium]|nr:hypothetical protein [Verrucomicrobiota bacterium]
MKTARPASVEGSTLVVTIAVVATILVLLGTAVDYTSHISRITQRTRKTALAMEIADGHLETLFSNWRNIYRTTWTTTIMGSATAGLNGGASLSFVGTNYFFTDNYNPGSGCAGCPAPTPVPYMNPAATPPTIPLPSRSLFPTDANYAVTQYRIQAVDPMITQDSNENAMVESSAKGSGGYVQLNAGVVPPASYGPNLNQYSLFYLAAVDVTVPSLKGNVTAKVRRVFEKKYDQPWTYGMFFVDDLELQPSSPFTITGPVHTNGNLYIGTSNFTATSNCEYGGDYVNGYSPKDPRYPGSSFTTPNFPQNAAHDRDIPPAQVSPFLPFGWTLNISTAAGSGSNNDSYHEIVERADPGTDQLAGVRYSRQPNVYRIVISTSNSVSIDRLDASGNVASVNANSFTGGSSQVVYQGKALYDSREGAAVKVTDIDIKNLITTINGLPSGTWGGVLYLADDGALMYNPDGTVKRAGTNATVSVNGVNYPNTVRRAFRLVNGYAVPSGGLTIVSENPVYIQGDYNAASTSSATIPSNNGTYTTPYASGYTKKSCAVVADAVTLLSKNWNDSASNSNNSNARPAANTTINTAIVAGNVPSNGTNYSGGGENFIRLLEDWHSNTICYYGSLVQLFASNQAIGPWDSAGTIYKAPSTSKFYYDDATFSVDAPPGRLEIAAYLQQQRWYQVY